MYSTKIISFYCLILLLIPEILWSQSVWQTEQLTDSKKLSKNVMDIAVASDGIVHVVYEIAEKVGDYTPGNVYYLTKTAGIWSEPINLGISQAHDGSPFVIIGPYRMIVDESGANTKGAGQAAH